MTHSLNQDDLRNADESFGSTSIKLPHFFIAIVTNSMTNRHSYRTKCDSYFAYAISLP